jgi:pimeloyl-ACP methyl ester carboxylesterase
MPVPFVCVAAIISVLALYLPTRTTTFTNVTVDGRNMRMLVTGQGETTVVFENGANGSLEYWGRVQPAVSRFARTVSYDRAGFGRSDPGPLPRDARHMATELRSALRAAGVQSPYLLVGASLGGPYVRVFAGMYPDDVSGLVLVDPSPDTMRVDRAQSLEGQSWPSTRQQAIDSRIPAGVPVLLIDARSIAGVPFTTEAFRAQRANSRPEIEADSREYARWLATVSGARLITTDRSGHNVAQEQPSIVIDAIQQVVRQLAGK